MSELHYKLSRELKWHQSSVRGIQVLTPSHFATSSSDKTILLWDMNSLDAPAKTFCGHAKDISCLTSFVDTENNRILLISGSHDNSAMVWSPFTPGADPVLVCVGHTSAVVSLAVNHAGTLLATGSWDKSARIWDLKTGTCLCTINGHQQSVVGLMFTPDDKFLVTASADKNIRVWSVNNGSYVCNYDPVHSDTVRCLTPFINPGEALTTDNAGCLVHWDRSGHALSQHTEHRSFLYNVHAGDVNNPAGPLVLTSGEDHCVYVWKDFRVAQVLHHPNTVWTSAVLPNGDIATCCSDGVVRLWTQDPSRAASDAAIAEYEKAIKGDMASGAADYKVYAYCDKDSTRGKFDGETRVFSNGKKHMVHSWNAGKESWDYIGDVVTGQEGKNVYKGVEYDYVFDVELDGQWWKLPYNVSENPYMTAQSFIDEHDLQQDMLDEIALFIIKQTDSDPRKKQEEMQYSDPFTGANAYVPGKERVYAGKQDSSLLPGYHAPPPEISSQETAAQKQRRIPSGIPQRGPRPFTIDNTAVLFNKLREASAALQPSDTVTPLSSEEISSLESTLPSLPAPSIITKLLSYPSSALVLVMGYFSILVTDPESLDVLSSSGLFSSLFPRIFADCPPASPQRQMAIRALANAASTSKGVSIIFSPSVFSVISSALSAVFEEVPDGARSAAARFLYNTAVNVSGIPNTPELDTALLDLFIKSLSKELSDTMVTANTLLAVCNVFYLRPTVRKSSKLQELINTVGKSISSSDTRLQNVAIDTSIYISN